MKLTVLLLAYSAAVAVLTVPYAWLAAVAIGVALTCRKPARLSAYGTARWATVGDISHLLEGQGIILGGIGGRVGFRTGLAALFARRLPAGKAVRTFLLACRRTQPPQIVRLTDAVMTAVFAPTGVGKSTSIVIPHLLTCPDNAVVLDVKGELVRETAAARARLGHRVVVLDPFGVVGGVDTFNPLEFVTPGRFALDECRELATAMVVRTGQERERHFDDGAEAWIATMCAMVVAFGEGPEKSLQGVRPLLTNTEKMAAAIQLMCGSDAFDGLLARSAHQLTHYKDRELGSVLTTVNRHMRFLDTPAVADSTRASTFDPAGLVTSRMTVYLVLPPEHQKSQSGLLRLWIGSLLRAVVKGGLSSRRVHFVIDEAASLSHMEQIDQAVDQFRGYGVRLLLLYQSLGQLQRCFPSDGQAQTLLSNVTQVFFGVNDWQTAEYVSNRLGEFTQMVASGGTSTSRSSQWSPQGGDSTSYTSGTSENWSQAARRLLQPPEVMALDPRMAVTFHPGVPPMATCLTRHYEGPVRLDPGPGGVKAAIDTACLFLVAVVIAVLLTVPTITLSRAGGAYGSGKADLGGGTPGQAVGWPGGARTPDFEGNLERHREGVEAPGRGWGP